MNKEVDRSVLSKLNHSFKQSKQNSSSKKTIRSDLLGNSMFQNHFAVQEESQMKKCDIHKEQELVGVCLKQSVVNRVVCYECIYQEHNDHQKEILMMGALQKKEKDQLDILFDSQDVTKVYNKVMDYRDKYENEVLGKNKEEEKLKENYKQMFRKLLIKLQETIDKKIEEIFDKSKNRSMFLLDQLFQRVYPIDMIVHQFNNLKNTNKVGRQIQELIDNVDRMKEDQEEKNKQILRLNEVKDGEKMSEQVDKLYNSIKAQVEVEMKKTVEYSRLIEGNVTEWGYQPLMKLEGNDMGFNTDKWTKKVPEIVQQFERHQWSGSSQVYDNYYKLNVKQILIEYVDDQQQSRYCVLQKAKYRPLVDEFKDEKTQVLRRIDGCDNPLILMGGNEMADVKVLEKEWRINSYSVSHKDKQVKVRLGCHFVAVGNEFGRDRANLPCSLEVAGLGITDEYYKGSQCRIKSSGIRQFNDRNTLPNKVGQLYAKVNVYGR